MFTVFRRGACKKIIESLKLDKPLVIFSLETTGPSISSDKIVALAYLKIIANGRIIKDNFLLNPEMQVSEESTAIHGITDKELLNQPTFKTKAREIWDIFNNCYYGGFNIIDFDLPLIRREFIRIGMDFEYSIKDVVDLRIIFNYMEPRTLSGTYKYYCRKEHINVHNPLADVEAMAEILDKQLKKYKAIRDREFINEINIPHEDKLVEHERKFYWRNGEAYFNFSKYKGISLAEIVKKDPRFLEWILKADFPEETKSFVKRALRKKK